MESPVRWTNWKEADLRPYEGRLPRPPISRGEKGVLERRGSQTPDLEARRGFWNDIEGPVRWTKWKEADLRPYEGSLPDLEERRVKGALLGGRSGKKRTYGLTRVVYPDPRSRGGSGTTWRALLRGRSGKKRTCGPTALRGSFTQDPDLEARRGFWNDMESLLGGRRGKKLTWSTLLGGRSGKKRTYGLTKVVYPDPRSRGEKGVLGRHGEPC